VCGVCVCVCGVGVCVCGCVYVCVVCVGVWCVCMWVCVWCGCVVCVYVGVCVFRDSCPDSHFSEDGIASTCTSLSICIAFFIEASNGTFNPNISGCGK